MGAVDRRYDLVIVGMGSAGIVAAELASKLGVKVAAVERDRVGGDCLWTGCVPSKALLASAKAANAMRHPTATGSSRARHGGGLAARVARRVDLRGRGPQAQRGPGRPVALPGALEGLSGAAQLCGGRRVCVH